MSQYIVFDCYQTLIYKKNLEKIVQDFSRDILKKIIPLAYIKYGYETIYDRYKFRHPRLETPKQRENFYLGYNKELFEIMGFSVSSDQALELSQLLKKAVWVRYSDTLVALDDMKTREIPMGLLTNWTKTLDQVLKDVKLTPYFDFVHSSHTLKIEKPNPKVFVKALKNIIKKFNKVYYVGDDYELDVVPARYAGLIPILIDRDNRYPDSVDCLRIERLTDLKKIVK